jgi:hypothetical protein
MMRTLFRSRSDVIASLRSSKLGIEVHVDPIALDAIGRMGGDGYVTTRDYFDLTTMSVEEWSVSGRDANEKLWSQR